MYLREFSKRITVDDKNRSWKHTELVPTNKLILISTFHWLHEISWKDGRVPLEFHLQNIISKLEMKSIEEKEYRQRVEKGWAEQKEKDRLRKEAEALRANEISEFKELLLKSKRWKKAVGLRNYLDANENNAIQNDNLTEEKIKWFEWARKKADWYDPEIEAEDELLKNVDRDDLSKQKTKTSIFNSFEN